MHPGSGILLVASDCGAWARSLPKTTLVVRVGERRLPFLSFCVCALAFSSTVLEQKCGGGGGVAGIAVAGLGWLDDGMLAPRRDP